MKILHTSDLHLAENRPETMTALEQILATATDLSVDLLTIGGDMFESNTDAAALRTRLRSLFKGNPFKVIAIPGNHDREAFVRNVDFGADFAAATQEPFEVFRYDKEEVALVGLPFRDRPTPELLNDLKDAAPDAKHRLLMLHCSLDIASGKLDFGKGESADYFPISSRTLGGLGYDYVLAGHFHSNTDIRRLEPTGYFIYPGSPTSHSRKELGERQAVLVDLTDPPPVTVPLNTFYRDYLRITVLPGSEAEAVRQVEDWIKERIGKDCEMEVEVAGFIAMDEKTFGKNLVEVAEGVNLIQTYEDIRQVLDHPLFESFEEKLGQLEDATVEEGASKTTVEAMIRLLAERRISS
jgi:DNA repair exonuclease SbcCD nuclease subunit